MSRMFPFITSTRNPVRFKCSHECSYCWSQAKGGLVDRFELSGYRREPTLDHLEEINERMLVPSGEFIFLCDMLDLFAENVPKEIIHRVLEIPKNNPDVQFLLSTKNPKRYLDLWDVLHNLENCILGCTIESNRNYPEISKAPSQFDRLYWMDKAADVLSLYKRKVFVCVEPILDFDLKTFEMDLYRMKPWAVAIGYDNYNFHLPEPPLVKTMQLIETLEKSGITVYRKTLRRAWG